jgi:alpha-L-fucosidase 2
MQRICVRALFSLHVFPILLAGAGVVASAHATKPEAAVLPPSDGYALAQHAAIVLQRSNASPREAMPLGNGSLGAAVWSADGMTVQLNRADTLPKRQSPGQVVLPGLKKLTSAPDYQGRLDLATGEFTETGGGMQATAYIEAGTDALVVTVTGVDADSEQMAELRLWAPRQPRVLVRDGLGTLAETWQDVGDAGASGQTFGSLASMHVDADAVNLAVQGSEAVVAHFHADKAGSYRIVVAAPGWRGEDAVGIAADRMQKALAEPAQAHRDWWRRYWSVEATPLAIGMHADSADTAATAPDDARYFEELREIYLYTAAAEAGTQFPGSHAGIGDLFSSMRDERHWDPSAYWHWNLRMLTAANLSAGVSQLNQSYFNLYRSNLTQIEAWTKQHMDGRPGICVPETMRFNGKGYENETWVGKAAINCGEDSAPYYNARTLSTGAEVALWIWRQYKATDDRAFLEANYPVMREQARFLLAYAKADSAGTLHTFPSNAHETQWDVHDPLTDIVAMRVVFPKVAEAATLLGKDAELVAQLHAATAHLLPLPEADVTSPNVPLKDPDQNAILVNSYDPGAALHNVENIGLEPVWPYDLIGPQTGDPMHAVGVRTFETRPNKNEADWSDDPLQAAHLGLADAMRASLRALTETYQKFPSGMAEFISHDFFVEQIGVLTASLDDALVQQKADGTILIAPALPGAWDADGTVALEHGVRVRVIASKGRVQAVAIMPGPATGAIQRKVLIKNPWPNERLRVTDGHRTRLFAAASVLTLKLPKAGTVSAAAMTPLPMLVLEPVGGSVNAMPLPADCAPLQLGSRMIGLPSKK